MSGMSCDNFGAVSWENHEDEEDEFEKEMEAEMSQRIRNAEKESGLTSSTQQNNLQPPDGEGVASTSSGKGGLANKGVYDAIYFDSDEENEENRKVPDDQDIFYDPEMDDRDQEWVDQMRGSYLTKERKKFKSDQSKSGVKPLPNSDAVLNCPACFTLLTLDCQRHEVYESQYRAMFVMNCQVNTSQKLKFPLTKSQKRKTSRKSASEFENETEIEEEYNPVICQECDTEVGVYDKDEVYHFFNVLASYA